MEFKATAPKPLVSIGMPVYNGGELIHRALESLLSQSFENFEIIISDNASDDATETICRTYAANDKRVRYIRQKINLGATHNFRTVLDGAIGDYFMWAACDDIRSPDFVSANLEFLRSHPDYVASTSPTRFEGDTYDERRMGDGSMDGDPPSRIRAMLGTVHANGRFYSLIRRSALNGCPGLEKPFLGSDWVVVLHLLKQGKINRSPKGWVILGKHGASSGGGVFRTYRTDLTHLLIPFIELSGYTWGISRGFNITDKITILSKLVIMNAKVLIGQFRAPKR